MSFPFDVSHSQITTIQQCPLKFHLKYRTQGHKGISDESKALQYGREVHAAVEAFVKKGTEPTRKTFSDPEPWKMWGHWLETCWPQVPKDRPVWSEQKWRTTFHGVPLMGRLDLMWVKDDVEDEPHTVYICDVKTGGSLYFTEQRLWFSMQPDIYGILARANVPSAEEIVWVQHNVSADGASVQQRHVDLTPAREKNILYWLNAMDEDSAQPIEGYHCGQCPYRERCEGRLYLGGNQIFEYREQASEVDVDGVPVLDVRELEK